VTQYHYLDDSGDPGLSKTGGSSSHFALAMVQLADTIPLPELATARRQLHFPPTFEFKYFKSKPNHKAAFFQAVKPVEFRVRAVVVDKADLPRWLASARGEELAIELIVRLAVRSSELDIGTDFLIVDQATPEFRRKLRIRLSTEYRRLNRVRAFKKIAGGNSAREDGLQLADMIAGAARHFVIGDERGYLPMFEDKIVDLWRVNAREK
jgi:hypothetical protein